MVFWLWAVIIVLACGAAALSVKVFFLHRAAREIRQGFAQRLRTDTNTLIDLSSRDAVMRELAAGVNEELKELRRQRQRYLQGDAELKEAVTNISHDLRTPLTAICGYLELLKEEETTAQAQRYLAQIENRVEAMKELTEELFRYSVVTSDQGLELELLDLGGALEESLLSYYGAMEQRGITPEIHMPSEKVMPAAGPYGCEPRFQQHHQQRRQIQRRGPYSSHGTRRQDHLCQFGQGPGRRGGGKAL